MEGEEMMEEEFLAMECHRAAESCLQFKHSAEQHPVRQSV